MTQFESIQNKAQKLNEQMTNFIRAKYNSRNGNPELEQLFLMHCEVLSTDGLEKLSTTELLRFCGAINEKEKEAQKKKKSEHNAEAAAKRFAAIQQMAENAAQKKAEKKPESLVIYTDGGYSNEKKIGAGAYIVLKNNRILRKGGDRLTDASNNIAELSAIKFALLTVPDRTKVEIRTDSQYAIGVLSDWCPKANLTLINGIKEHIRNHNIEVTFRWVRGHSGDKYNEMCDKMCDQIAGMDLNAEYEKFKKYKK